MLPGWWPPVLVRKTVGRSLSLSPTHTHMHTHILFAKQITNAYTQMFTDKHLLTVQTCTCSNPHTFLYTLTQLDKTIALLHNNYVHTHTHTCKYTSTLPWHQCRQTVGSTALLLCHFSFGSGPSSVQHHDLPTWSHSPPAVNKTTHCVDSVCVCVCRWVTNRERE